MAKRKPKTDENQMALVDKGPKKDRDDDRSIPKRSADSLPEGDAESTPGYGGSTIEELENQFKELAEKVGGAWKSGEWNGASYISLETPDFDQVSLLVKSVKELSMEYRFRSSTKIDVIGIGGMYKIRATLPGKITNNKFV